MCHRIFLPILLMMLLSGCAEAKPPAAIEADDPAEPIADSGVDDLLGIWSGSQQDVVLRFTADGRYCLAKHRDEIETFPGDCGTFEVLDTVLTLTSDTGYCKGEAGQYSMTRTALGHLQMKVLDDDCDERSSTIKNKTLVKES